MRIVLKTYGKDGWIKSSPAYSGYNSVRQDEDLLIFVSDAGMPDIHIRQQKQPDESLRFQFMKPYESEVYDSIEISSDFLPPSPPARR